MHRLARQLLLAARAGQRIARSTSNLLQRPRPAAAGAVVAERELENSLYNHDALTGASPASTSCRPCASSRSW